MVMKKKVTYSIGKTVGSSTQRETLEQGSSTSSETALQSAPTRNQIDEENSRGGGSGGLKSLGKRAGLRRKARKEVEEHFH